MKAVGKICVPYNIVADIKAVKIIGAGLQLVIRVWYVYVSLSIIKDAR